uniref:Leucine rich immune protein (Coil-less) n=1 Tax=Anopheles maculatus TaxID=74869 RepID=A0A182SZ99_9DIPT
MEYGLKFVIVVVLCATFGEASGGHRCLAGSEPFVCILQRFDYNPGDDIPLFALSPGVKSIRFIEPIFNLHDSQAIIHMYDRVFHQQLNSPLAVELTGSYTTVLEIPDNLEYADFSDNSLERLHVPLNRSYALRYLDLNSNYRLNIQNISLLVNLETLHLSTCNIETLPVNMFENLNRLAHLTLAANSIHKIDLDWFPMSLKLLRLDQNFMAEFHFSGTTRLPLLEDLNIEYNDLTELNIRALLETAPKLRLFSIGRNPLKRAELNGIVDELNQRNIAYYNMEDIGDRECTDGEHYFRGVCMPASVFELSWVEKVKIGGFIVVLVALVVGIAFGAMFLRKRFQPS